MASTDHPPTEPCGISRYETGEWIMLYHHFLDENDHIIVEEFHVYICGPPSAAPSSLFAPLQPTKREGNASLSSPVTASSLYSGETIRPSRYQDAPSSQATIAVSIPQPRRPRIVMPGVAPPRTGDGILSESQRLHLQSWLNDCRQCSTNGIHRAAFSPRTQVSASLNLEDVEEQDGLEKQREWQTIYLATPPATPPISASGQHEDMSVYFSASSTPILPTNFSVPISGPNEVSIRPGPSLAQLITSNLRSPASTSYYSNDPDPATPTSDMRTTYLANELNQEQGVSKFSPDTPSPDLSYEGSQANTDIDSSFLPESTSTFQSPMNAGENSRRRGKPRPRPLMLWHSNIHF